MEGTNNAVKLEYGPGCEIETMEELQEIMKASQEEQDEMQKNQKKTEEKPETDSEPEDLSVPAVSAI